MISENYVHSHDETAKLIKIPEHLGLLTIDDCLKNGEVHIDDEMADIISIFGINIK